MVSVIMSTYNGEKTIDRAIESICAQSYEDFELIICDDCSIDNTIDVIRRYESKDNRVKVLRNETNMGLAASLNLCLAHSRGDYIARMDDDDISHYTRLQKQVEFLDKNPEYVIVGTRRNNFDSNGIWGTTGIPGEITNYDIIAGRIFTHPSVMMRRTAIERVGGYTVSDRTKRGQDFDLWCKMYSFGFKGYVIDDILIDYYVERNKVKENTFQIRYNLYKTHKLWRKKMKLPLWCDIYAYKEILALIIPQNLLRIRKKNR